MLSLYELPSKPLRTIASQTGLKRHEGESMTMVILGEICL